MLAELAGAVAFMTRVPVPGTDWSIPLSRLAAWFPAAGLLVGAASAAALWTAGAVGLPPLAAAVAAIAAEMLITGGLHPDGLADTADGLAGPTPERRLEIMKDPRLGSYGGIALFLTLAGRAALLPALPLSAVIAAHAIARWAPVWALARYPYARPSGGLGASFVGAGWREILIAGAGALAAAWLLAGPRGLAAAGVGAVAGMALTAFVARKLGGITGDTCGAAIEISLLAALTAFAAHV